MSGSSAPRRSLWYSRHSRNSFSYIYGRPVYLDRPRLAYNSKLRGMKVKGAQPKKWMSHHREWSCLIEESFNIDKVVPLNSEERRNIIMQLEVCFYLHFYVFTLFVQIKKVPEHCCTSSLENDSVITKILENFLRKSNTWS